MLMYSITSKLNSTFGMIDKATADKVTAKVVGKLKLSLKREEFEHAVMQAKRTREILNNFSP